VIGEQLAALIGLSVGVVIGVSTSIIAARRGKLSIPLIPTLIAVLSTAMAVEGFVEGDLAVIRMAMVLLFIIYPLIWRANSIALRAAYSALLIAVPALFIAAAGIEAILTFTGILALVGIAIGIANIVMLAKH